MQGILTNAKELATSEQEYVGSNWAFIISTAVMFVTHLTKSYCDKLA